MSDLGAQFGMAKLLRPYKGWETVYQGRSSLEQILWLPTDKDYNGIAYDPLADKPEYADTLANAMSVPLGAKLYIWLPRIGYADGATRAGYQWMIGWRLRTLNCFMQKKSGPYHLPFFTQRAAGKGIGAVIPLPYSVDGVVYEQAEEVGLALQRQHFKQPESYNYPNQSNVDHGASAARNPTNDDVMFLQQGIPVVNGSSPTVEGGFMCLEKVAKGDELVVSCFRANTALGTYNFATGSVDASIKTYVNSPDNPFLGVYVIVGMNS